MHMSKFDILRTTFNFNKEVTRKDIISWQNLPTLLGVCKKCTLCAPFYALV